MTTENAVDVTLADTSKPPYFSPTMGIRIMNDDSILENVFIEATITESSPETIQYEDDHILLIVSSEEFTHFMHLVYQYSDKQIICIFDGVFNYEITDPEKECGTYIAQLITITESHINK